MNIAAQQQFQPQTQPQQFQTTIDDEQSLESETDQHAAVRRDSEREEEHVDQDLLDEEFD